MGCYLILFKSFKGMWIFLITVKDWPGFRAGWWLQEQSLSSQIVRVVIAGGSVDLQTSLSNGQACWDFFPPCIFCLVAFFSWIFCLQSHWCNPLLFPSWSRVVSKFVMSSTPTRLQNIRLLVQRAGQMMHLVLWTAAVVRKGTDQACGTNQRTRSGANSGAYCHSWIL